MDTIAPRVEDDLSATGAAQRPVDVVRGRDSRISGGEPSEKVELVVDTRDAGDGTGEDREGGDRDWNRMTGGEESARDQEMLSAH